MNDDVIDMNKWKKEKTEKLERFASGDFRDFDDFFEYCEIHSKSDKPYFSGEYFLMLAEMTVGLNTELLPKGVVNKLLQTPPEYPLPYNLVMKSFLNEIQRRRDSLEEIDLDLYE